jgi:hypothetical protein
MPIISKYQEVEAIDEIEKGTAAEGLSFAFEGTFLRFTMDSIQKLYRHVSVTGTRSTREINKTD